MTLKEPAFFGEHAVIVGAGIGGLAAAGALAGHFSRVTVLERDALPLDAAGRARLNPIIRMAFSWVACAR